MAVRQLSVFIENKKGMLVEVTRALKEAGVDIRALSLAETEYYGILRLIVSDFDKAYDAVLKTGRTVKINHVLALRVDDRPGGLSDALELLNRESINVEYMYAFICPEPDRADVVLRVSDTQTAETVLKNAGFEVRE